jgi:hypothetical protein
MAVFALLVMGLIDVGFLIVTYVSFKDYGKKKAALKKMDDYAAYKAAYSDVIKDEPDRDTLLHEYRMAQDRANHFDNLNWQIGSILIGSNIVALGFLSGVGNIRLLFAAAVGGSASLFAWIMWFVRHRAMINISMDRLYMIEMKLSMAQHRMVGFATEKKWLPRVDGNKVALVLFLGLLVAWLIVLT